MNQEYTIDQIQEMASLRIQIHNCDHELQHYKKLMTQLLNDNVDFHLSFQIHNNTICAQNKARYRVKSITEDAPFGLLLPYTSNHLSCRSEYLKKLDESAALRIFNVLVSETEKVKSNLENQLKAALKINFTPIQYLYETKS